MKAVIPRATEKAYFEQAKRTYMVIVPDGTSKQEAAKLVSEQYGVTVTDVRIMVRKGKATRFSRGKHAYPGTTYRHDKRIAYVTLKEGDKIKIFEEAEETKKDAKSAKAAKKAEKKGDK